MSNDNNSENSPRKLLQNERNKLLRDVMKLRQQQAKLSSSMKPNVRKYQDYQKYKNYVNQIQNKLDNFTKALRNEICLPEKQSDSGPFYVSKGIDEFNTFLKTKIFGDNINSNYIVGGALLGKIFLRSMLETSYSVYSIDFMILITSILLINNMDHKH